MNKKHTHANRLAGLLMAFSLASSALFPAANVMAQANISPAAAVTDEEEDNYGEVHLLAVGDDLIHEPVYKACRTKNGYSFKQIFSKTKSYVQDADLAVINQETIFVDKNYSGYPRFGSPKQLGDAIADAGFNIVTSATNHANDKGTSAISGTLNYWKKNHPEIKILGIHKSKKDASKIAIVKKNGIKFAMLNYTYSLNGHDLSRSQSYMVDRLDSASKIRNDIKRAKKVSDFVIVFAHWGTEYQYKPSSYQETWAKRFSDAGVDLVIGGHPHVLEPVKVMERKDGHKMLVYYSLGNFVSRQTKRDRMLGGMAEVTIVKDDKGARIKDYKLSATVTHIVPKSKRFTVYKLEDYTDSLAKGNYITHLSHNSNFNLSYLKKTYKAATGKSYPAKGKFKS